MPRGVVDLEGLKSPQAEALRRLAPPAGLPFAVRKLGHVVLKVKDMAHALAFYTGVLGFRVADVYPESMMKGGMVFLRCNADHHCLALVGGAQSDASARELHHLAFELATLDELLRAREHLRRHKVKIDYEGRRRAGCQMAVEFRDPDKHCLELYWGLDQVGSDHRVRPPEEWREAHSLEDAIAHAPPGQDTTLHSK
ncbi:MAG: VOC family protein [Betaproteobacteria bacterium]|nr:VOC family protein [Betaproteobacteria bacterium]